MHLTTQVQHMHMSCGTSPPIYELQELSSSLSVVGQILLHVDHLQVDGPPWLKMSTTLNYFFFCFLQQCIMLDQTSFIQPKKA